MSKTLVSWKLDSQIKDKFKIVCEKKGLMMSHVVENLIAEWLAPTKEKFLAQLQSLDDVLKFLKSDLTREEEMALGDNFYNELPVFGCKDYNNADEVWSWNETHKIIGTCIENFEIVRISAYEHRKKYLTSANENLP